MGELLLGYCSHSNLHCITTQASMKTLLSSVILLMLLCGTLSGQPVPPLVNYQGQLTDSSDAALSTADYELTFRIWDATEGGNLGWGPQVLDGHSGAGHGPKIPVVQCYFTVLLGPVDTEGGALLGAFGGSTRFVEVAVAGKGTIAPRQQVLSAPFAVVADKARIAESVGGGTLTTTQSGNVGVGTSDPQVKLDVAANVASGYRGNFMARYESGETRYAGALGWNWLQLENNGGNYIVGGRTATGGGLVFLVNNTRDIRNAGKEHNGTEAMMLRTDGIVGIGTSAPAAELHVAGDTQIDRDLKVAGARFRELAPPGSILAFGGASVPPGWLLCDGRAASRSGNADLFAAIGTAWRDGDNISAFNLSDLRGLFLRGVDQSQWVSDGHPPRDPERTSRTELAPGGNSRTRVGSLQTEAFKAHNHKYGWWL